MCMESRLLLDERYSASRAFFLKIRAEVAAARAILDFAFVGQIYGNIGKYVMIDTIADTIKLAGKRGTFALKIKPVA